MQFQKQWKVITKLLNIKTVQRYLAALKMEGVTFRGTFYNTFNIFPLLFNSCTVFFILPFSSFTFLLQMFETERRVRRNKLNEVNVEHSNNGLHTENMFIVLHLNNVTSNLFNNFSEIDLYSLISVSVKLELPDTEMNFSKFLYRNSQSAFTETSIDLEFSFCIAKEIT